MKRPSIQFASVNDLLGAPTDDITEIPTEQISAFSQHPFKVLDNSEMEKLIESIRENGVLNPVIVRQRGADYEMISGHRRLHAAKIAGLKELPAIIKNMSDDEAVIAMVDSNLQRERLLPSERAWSLRLKTEAVKRQGKRTDLTSGNDCQKLNIADIGEELGVKERQVRNYIRLTYLILELLQMVDNNRLTFVAAVEISFFDKNDQGAIYEYLQHHKLSLKQIKTLREYVKNGGRLEDIETLLSETRTVKRKFVMKEKSIRKYFPDDYTTEQIEKTITELLEQWRRK